MEKVTVGGSSWTCTRLAASFHVSNSLMSYGRAGMHQIQQGSICATGQQGRASASGSRNGRTQSGVGEGYQKAMHWGFVGILCTQD